MTIGVLELQGDFEKHHQILQTLGFESVSVRNQIDLQTISGLVIPGGESTTFSKLIDQNNLRKSLKVFANKYPILGTCAGLIIMAQKVSDSKVNPLGIFDVDVTRNAYGRQINSSTENIQFLIFSKANTQIKIRIIAINTLKPEFMRGSKSPSPECEPSLGSLQSYRLYPSKPIS